jgi:enamine deaminase RidA (YjgF/YER057c/UK114 family)
VIRKVVDRGVGFSAVDLNDVRHVFATAVPRRGATLGQQASDALRTIEAVIEQEGTADSIVQQAVFLADVNQVDECRDIIRKFYGGKVPATSYIPQPPCEGKLLSIEALGVGGDHGKVEIERRGEQLVIARHNGISWVHCAQTVPQTKAGGVYEGGLSAFEQMRSLFASVGVGFEQVIRTWLYLGGIVADEGPTQRYKELNRARTDFFRDLHFRVGRPPDGFHGSIYPASTGIGTEGRGIMMSAIALATERADILAVPLENPRQVSAHEYPDHYSPKSPKFSRAMALSCGTYATIFISGTASITASETRHVGDAARQTDETLDNIAALIGEENLARHGLPGLGTALDSLGLVRVYIKRQEDYERVRAVCERRLGEMPTIYAMADVCRPELLVEIEGIAFSHKASETPAGDEAPEAESLPADRPHSGPAPHIHATSRAAKTR